MPRPQTFMAAAALLLPVAPAGADPHDYLVVERAVDVARPAAAVWRTAGDICFIGKMLDISCTVEGGSGGPGSLRRLNGNILEAIVARTPTSYTYSQLEGPRAGTDYHGTLAVAAAGARRSRLTYTVVIDRERLPASTNAADYQKAIADRFQAALDKARTLVEAAR